MKAAAIAFSDKGFETGKRAADFFLPDGDFTLTRCENGKLKTWAESNFNRGALIFIGSCGIAVRAVAPLLKNKTTDPAVVVIDESAAFVISLLSGHIGGANELTKNLARFLNAVPIVTTATDARGEFAIDSWAVKNGLKILNPERVKKISSRLLAGEKIGIKSDFPIDGPLPKGFCAGDDAIITFQINNNSLVLIPPVVTLGIGLKKNIPAENIERVFQIALNNANCYEQAVCGVFSIDLKAREPGLLEFCAARGLTLKTFSARELAEIPGSFTASEFVKKTTGVDNVCERAAALGANGGRLILKKEIYGGVSAALAIKDYSVNFGGGRL
jgi:cobalt-precorrin 5A hydrolase